MAPFELAASEELGGITEAVHPEAKGPCTKTTRASLLAFHQSAHSIVIADLATAKTAVSLTIDMTLSEYMDRTLVQ